MRTNKAILDEAARSVRRTFVGSAAGTLGMLAVVGAAGAYGMPERLNAQALSAALTTLQFRLSPTIERAAPPAGRAVTIASDTSHRAPAPALESEQPATRQEMPVAAVAPAVMAMPAPVEAMVPSTDPDPTSSVPMNGDAQSRPETANGNSAPAAEPMAAPRPIEAPAEAPNRVDAPKRLETSPVRSETTETAAPVKPAAKVETKAEEQPQARHYPKTVMVQLPHPKPP